MKFRDVSLTLNKFFFHDHFLTCGNHAATRQCWTFVKDVLFKFVDVEVLFRELHCKYVNEQSLAKLICPPEASHELFIFYLFYFPQTSRDLISMVYVTIEVPALYYLGKVQMVHHRFPIIRDHRSSYRPLLLFSTGEFHNKSVNDLVPRDQSWRVYR